MNGDPAIGVRLTQRGRVQARELGERAGPVDLVVHTEFERTRETAELAWPGVPKLVVAELNESAFGSFEGTHWSEGFHEWSKAAGPLDDCPGGGESRAALVGRFVRGYRRVLEQPEQRIAVVAHGAPVRYALLAAAGRPPTAVLEGVTPAEPFVLTRAELEAATQLLEAWAASPSW